MQAQIFSNFIYLLNSRTQKEARLRPFHLLSFYLELRIELQTEEFSLGHSDPELEAGSSAFLVIEPIHVCLVDEY